MLTLDKTPSLTLDKTPSLTLDKAPRLTLDKTPSLTLDKAPRLTLKKPALPETIYLPFIVPHVTLSQVFFALRKQTIKARPTVCASFWRYRKSGYCYIHANGITKRVSADDFFSIQQNADKRYSFWNDGEKSGSGATVRKCFLIGFGVNSHD